MSPDELAKQISEQWAQVVGLAKHGEVDQALELLSETEAHLEALSHTEITQNLVQGLQADLEATVEAVNEHLTVVEAEATQLLQQRLEVQQAGRAVNRVQSQSRLLDQKG